MSPCSFLGQGGKGRKKTSLQQRLYSDPKSRRPLNLHLEPLFRGGVLDSGGSTYFFVLTVFVHASAFQPMPARPFASPAQFLFPSGGLPPTKSHHCPVARPCPAAHLSAQLHPGEIALGNFPLGKTPPSSARHLPANHSPHRSFPGGPRDSLPQWLPSFGEPLPHSTASATLLFCCRNMTKS